MISKVFNHSTRNISFLVDELKLWTKDDERLIKSYIKIHDHEQNLANRARELNTETQHIRDAIEQTRKHLVEVEKQIKELSKFADTFHLADPKKEEKAEQIFDKADKVYGTIDTHQHLFEELEKKIEKFCALKSAFLNSLEDFTLWEKFDKIRNKHAQRYKVNSIDIVTFEMEEELFKDYVSVHT
ncbi:MAG: hypothetical protein JO072_11610 [Parafilimonas sp.]|nr:hypothetical protein [Parafilimonas sp.]